MRTTRGGPAATTAAAIVTRCNDTAASSCVNPPSWHPGTMDARSGMRPPRAYRHLCRRMSLGGLSTSADSGTARSCASGAMVAFRFLSGSSCQPGPKWSINPGGPGGAHGVSGRKGGPRASSPLFRPPYGTSRSSSTGSSSRATQRHPQKSRTAWEAVSPT